MSGRLQFARRVPGRSPLAVIWWDLCRMFMQGVVKLCFGLRVVGRERVPRSGPLLYLSNHQSYLDPVISSVAAADRPFSPFARESLFRGPFGWLIRSLGAMPVTGGNADKSIMRAALAELDAGRCVLVYPEGTRTPDGALQPFKTGVALLLRRSKATIVPVGIEGSFDAWPRQRSRPRFRRPIEVEVGEPIRREDLLSDGVPAALERLEAEIDGLRRRCRERLRARRGAHYPAPGPGDGPTPIRSSDPGAESVS